MLDLNLEVLDSIESPDAQEFLEGVAAGVAVAAGLVLFGIAIAT